MFGIRRCHMKALPLAFIEATNQRGIHGTHAPFMPCDLATHETLPFLSVASFGKEQSKDANPY